MEPANGSHVAKRGLREVFSMIARSVTLAAAVVMAAGSAAMALDQSRRDIAPRGPAELCCVDTALLPPLETNVAPDRHAFNQAAPANRARPGLDGADWNCRRPDGSHRCFTALRDQ
jgi:hypothetical protein